MYTGDIQLTVKIRIYMIFSNEIIVVHNIDERSSV